MKLLDVHTHLGIAEKREHQIVSVDLKNALEVGLEPMGPFSIGIHPWFIDEIVIDEAYDLLKEYIVHEKCMALGEAGIDRSIKTPVSEQIEVFENQIQLAMDQNIQAIIIHCVRSYPDILNIIKKKNYRGSLVFHDYNGKPDMTSQLLRYNVFFSYGAKLFNEKSGGYQSFTHIPNHRILLESDDMNHKTIEDVYKKASELLGLDLENLHQMVLENAVTAFGKSIPLTPLSK